MDDLFAAFRSPTQLGEGAVWLPGLAEKSATALLENILHIAARAPFRRFLTPGGRSMSVEMTSCGACGWYSDRRGYRYVRTDPQTGRPWPDMPPLFCQLAQDAAGRAGFKGFDPTSCLINRYGPGAKMGLHQDQDEDCPQAPIVSVSLGVPARFAFGGLKRNDPVRQVDLLHGDVVVWGGASRFAWHGVSPVRETFHPQTEAMRYNLTFRAINPACFQP